MSNKLNLTEQQIAERLAATHDAIASVELEGLIELSLNSDITTIRPEPSRQR